VALHTFDIPCPQTPVTRGRCRRRLSAVQVQQVLISLRYRAMNYRIENNKALTKLKQRERVFLRYNTAPVKRNFSAGQNRLLDWFCFLFSQATCMQRHGQSHVTCNTHWLRALQNSKWNLVSRSVQYKYVSHCISVAQPHNRYSV